MTPSWLAASIDAEKEVARWAVASPSQRRHTTHQDVASSRVQEQHLGTKKPQGTGRTPQN